MSNGNTDVPKVRIEGKGTYTGPAMKILQSMPGSPTALALDEIVGAMRTGLTELKGDWTPALLINRMITLIDAEQRLGRGGDMKGVCLQVAGLALIALEKLELNK